MAEPIRELTGRWHHFFDGMQYSAQEFYDLVEENIKNREIPKARLSRVKFCQDLEFWNKREYLRVVNEDYIFDIGASIYGTGFFVSWWTGQSSSLLYRLLIKLPFIGSFLETLLSSRTYYQHDLSTMFQEIVGISVQEAIKQISEKKGYRPLTEMEKRPTDTSIPTKRK